MSSSFSCFAVSPPSTIACLFKLSFKWSGVNGICHITTGCCGCLCKCIESNGKSLIWGIFIPLNFTLCYNNCNHTKTSYCMIICYCMIYINYLPTEVLNKMHIPNVTIQVTMPTQAMIMSCLEAMGGS